MTTQRTICTVTKWDKDDVSVEYVDLPDEVQDKLFRLIEPYCTGSMRGTVKTVLRALGKDLNEASC